MAAGMSMMIGVPLILTAIGTAVFAALLAMRNRSGRALPALLLLLFTVSLWAFATGCVILSGDVTSALFWTKVAFASLPLIPFALWYFVGALLGPTKWETRLVPAVFGVAILLMAWAQAGTSILQSIDQRWWGYYWSMGRGGLVLLAVFAATILSSTWRLTAASQVRRRRVPARQLRRMGLGLVIATLGLVDFVPSFGLGFPPVGTLAVGAAILFVSPLFWRDGFFEVSSPFAPATIMREIKGAVVAVDLDGRVKLANPAASELLEVPISVLESSRIFDIIESPYNVGPASDTLMRGDSFNDRPMLWKRRTGGNVQVSVSASMLRDELGIPAGLIYLATPIADQSRADQVSYQAYHDALTGLPNRKLYQNRVEDSLETFVREQRVPAVLFLDVDEFKLINDSLGHSTGDTLLQHVGRRLRQGLRGNDVVARVGGDEFAVLVDLRSADDLQLVADKLGSTLADPFFIGGQEIFVTACIGAALWPEHGRDPDELLGSADAALSRAKEKGKNRFEVFGESIRSDAVQRMSVASNLRRAIDNEDFELHYQPILDLEADSFIGAEALIRWRSHDELLSPAAFLSIAEESGMIRPIGQWVLREACSRAAAWSREFGIEKIAVNLSAFQIDDPDLPRIVADALALSGLEPAVLELEITETTAMQDFEQTIFLLQELKEIGVSLAIDDFGTGYSSLSYLERFPIDTLKIDQSFVRGLAAGRRGGTIISATLGIARALGLEVTAEGVEDRYQLAFLRLERCSFAQGFGISRPLPALALEEFLRAPDYPLRESDTVFPPSIPRLVR
jgi:diguanylate cyclase (GGDEF)-like protein